MIMHKIFQTIDGACGEYIEQLKELLRIPSISVDPQRAADVRRAADWMRDHFSAMGLKAQVFETERHPVVFAERCDAPGKPTVLFYGHCDVQPVDPIDEWRTEPFDPQEIDGNLVARGTSDDKGQMFTHVKAVEAWLRSGRQLPVNLKFVIEAEEEIGSPNLPKWLADHREMIAADVVVISDTAQFGPGLPSLCTGLRGIAAFEIHVRTAESDLHSGSFGGAVPNSVRELIRIAGTLHDADGRVAVPGFYDEVEEPSAEEKRSWAALPHSDREFLQTAGARVTWGEPGRNTLERVWSRPTLELIGIGGGYQGTGHKGIVPAQAFLKGSVRLVPGQKPATVIAKIREHVLGLAREGVEVEFKHGHGSPPVSIPTGSKWVGAAARALETGFGKQPVFIREGGSISIVTRFVEEYKMPCLLLGFGLPDDHIHGPNEKLSLEGFRNGIRTSAALMMELGKE